MTLEQGFFASAFLWVTTTTLIKLSILHLYVGIFERPYFRAAAYTVGILSVLFWIAYVLTGFLVCRPLAFNWDKTLHGTCGNTTSQEIGSATINMVLDLSIVILPMPLLWTLQLPLKKKFMLSGIFGLGLWCVKPHRCPDQLPICDFIQSALKMLTAAVTAAFVR